MAEIEEIRSSEIEEEGEEREKKQKVEELDRNVLRFLDSVDGYLTLLDSLSSTIRQGWLELASARHSMGGSRINAALLDLNFHSAATSVQVSEQDVDGLITQPHFTLCKWVSPDNERCCSGDEKSSEGSSQLRRRGASQFSVVRDKTSVTNGAPSTVDDQVQKERSKSLTVFGKLVSPKLRASQISFETALETLVEIANMRSSMLSTFDQVQKELETPRMNE